MISVIMIAAHNTTKIKQTVKISFRCAGSISIPQPILLLSLGYPLSLSRSVVGATEKRLNYFFGRVNTIAYFLENNFHCISEPVRYFFVDRTPFMIEVVDVCPSEIKGFSDLSLRLKVTKTNEILLEFFLGAAFHVRKIANTLLRCKPNL